MGIEIRGAIKRVTFSNEESGFCVLRMLADGPVGHLRKEVTVIGVLPGVRQGQELAVEGRWEESQKFGKQFRVERFRVIPPSTKKGIEQYLASGVIHGVGKVMAARIVETFGTQALKVIEEEPNRLTEIPGVGVRRARDIRRGWENQRGIQEVMVFLSSHGVSGALSARIYRTYGAEAVDVLRTNPYRLADEVFGIGFQTADKIAAELGIERDSPLRTAAGVMYILGVGVGEGHTFLPQEELVARCASLLESDEDRVMAVFPELIRVGKIVVEKDGEYGEIVYPCVLHSEECELAEAVGRLSHGKRGPATSEVEGWIHHVEKELDIRLAPEQVKAIESAMKEQLVVLTGGPGTGKTTLIRGIYLGFIQLGYRVMLCAPTGRAARRLGEATGGEAKTIHRLLEFSPRSREFERNAEHPLRADALIVDEASMMDVSLANALLQATPEDSKVVIVGDADQLPPVGPGTFLRDLIQSQCGKVVRLQQVFRQGQESLIVTNAHRVNSGLPLVEGHEANEKDFYVIPREDPSHILQTMKTLMTHRLSKAFGVDVNRDVQILTPMVSGELGTKNLNRSLQEWLNPEGDELERGDRVFRVGDKVMQIRNNYDKEVFNGDMGVIQSLDASARELVVQFDGRNLDYKSEELDELSLAYAVTVHKSQGSEYPVVLLPFHGQHFMLLRRNLLYTALTRGKQLVVVVGSERAIRMATERDDMNRRFSKLEDRLRRVFQESV